MIASGAISRDTEAAREVLESSKKGFPWQASIGAGVEEYEFVKEGTKVAVNGRNIEGPANVIRKWTLGEISFVDLGADRHTSARIAAAGARTGKEQDMEFEKWLKAKGLDPATLSAEARVSLEVVWKAEVAGQAPGPVFNAVDAEIADQKRKRDLEALALKYVKEAPAAAETVREIAAKAAEDSSLTCQTVELEMLRATRATPPQTFTGFSRGRPQLEAVHSAAALAIAAKMPDLEKKYPADVLTRAHDAFPQGLTLGELLLATAARNGYSGLSMRNNLRGVLRAAFAEDVQAAGVSTLSLPGILSSVANIFLLDAFMAVEQTWRVIAATRGVRDFKQITSYRLTGDMEYDEVGPDGELKHGTVGEEAFTNQAKTYGRMFALTRQDLINDDLGAFAQLPRRIGRGGALKLNGVFWTAFMNNATFFTNARNNYAIGAGTALAIAGLTAAEILFLNQTDADNKPLGIVAKILLTPPALKATGRRLMESVELRDTTANTQFGTKNPHAGNYTPAVSTYLSNGTITGHSAAAWYLLADPNDLPVIEVAFLNGQETPIVESADADFQILGIQFRGYYDFGVSKQDHRAGVKMRGT